MNATELRIGNWIYLSREECQVIAVNPKTARNFEPIPLTEGWLEKFDWEKLTITGYVISGATYYRKGNIVIYEIDGKYYLPMGEKIAGEFGRTVIEFDKVHELQNIFALTGEELEIKQ